MALVKRRTAVLITYLVFFVSLGLSLLYLYNFVVDFHSRMDTEIGNLNRLIIQLQSMEKELAELENFRENIVKSPKFDINGELQAKDLSDILMQILQSEVVELNYLMISCETPEPIIFDEKEYTFKVILKTGGSVSGGEDQ
ncbi:hypothetical protein [Fervidobacterium thailandense]|uniref:Fimbrial assembly protein n=1 Tax=Fervidobacterium thailandense TaxID=1008305 RepID=A0A1E3G338_9BACT|nr:hypothetical protein [Fervidobacterium thailandense]ODN30088.1 hypothetical protein A4H02_07230 [Fervidobacterium thailandense]